MTIYSRRFRPVGTAFALACALGAAVGCGSSESTTTTAPPATTGTTAAATTAAAGGGDCGDAAPEIKAALTGVGAVTAVDVPTCAKAVVTTSLGAGDGDAAASICQNAAAEASNHGVAAVSVVAAGGKELATGTDATDCKPA